MTTRPFNQYGKERQDVAWLNFSLVEVLVSSSFNMGGTFTAGLLFAVEGGCITSQRAEEVLYCAVVSDIIAGAIAMESIENAIHSVPSSDDSEEMEQET